VHAGGHRFGISTGFLLLILTGLIWGTIGICGRLVFDRTELDAVEVSWVRTLFAAPFCLAVGLRMMGRGLFKLPLADFVRIVLISATIFLYQFLYLVGVDAIGVTVATLISLCASPVLVALASVALFGEQPSTAVIASLVGAVGGTALLALGQGGDDGSGSLWVGIAASLASAVGIAVYALGSQSILKRYSPIVPLALGFPVTLVLFAPVMQGGHVNADIPISAWLLLIYLGVGTQGVAYLMFQRGLQTEGATVASIITLVEPVVTAILAWIMFDERLGLVGLLGAGMLIGALSVLTFGAGSRPSSPEHAGA
jgi:DME family drug/metabolite transporter